MSMEKTIQTTETKADLYYPLVKAELVRATKAYGPINSPHEGYGIIKEEIDEFWDYVKTNRNQDARKELVQVAAMCLRYLADSEHWNTDIEETYHHG